MRTVASDDDEPGDHMEDEGEESLGYRGYMVSEAKVVYEALKDMSADHSSVLSYCEAKRQDVKNVMEVRMVQLL